MIYQYEIRQINGLDYIEGYQVIAEKGEPSAPFTFSKPLKNLQDGKGKLQWTIRDNPNYNPDTDHIDDRYIIEQNPIQPTPEELEAEKQAAVKRQLVAELPDIILQNKDNPEVLVQALCDRAKQIETEIKNETGRDTKTV